jgi:hypothetical protein
MFPGYGVHANSNYIFKSEFIFIVDANIAHQFVKNGYAAFELIPLGSQ